MPSICRTPGCPEPATGPLGYCESCHARYLGSLADGARLAEAARHRHRELFTSLEERDARRLAEHLVGHARLGRRSVMFALSDFKAETRDAQRLRGSKRPRRRPA